MNNEQHTSDQGSSRHTIQIDRRACYDQRGLSSRMRTAREAHRRGGARAGIRAYCQGNRWLEENARSVGNL